MNRLIMSISPQINYTVSFSIDSTVICRFGSFGGRAWKKMQWYSIFTVQALTHSHKKLNVVYIFSLIALSYTPAYGRFDTKSFRYKSFRYKCIWYNVAAMCFLPNFAPRWVWKAFMCSHLCTYSHRYSIFVKAVTHSHSKIERSLCIFFW